MDPEGTGLAADMSLDDVSDFFQAHLCFLGEIRDCLCTDHVRHDLRHPYIERIRANHPGFSGKIPENNSVSRYTGKILKIPDFRPRRRRRSAPR